MSNAVMAGFADDSDELTLSEADRIDFGGGSVSVSFPGPRLPLHLSVRDEGAGIGEIGFDGSRVSFSGEPIGVLGSTGDGPDAASLRIELNARATAAAVETLVENLMLADPSGALTARTVLVTLADRRGRTSTVPFALRPAPPRPAPRLRLASEPRPGAGGADFMIADADSDGIVFANPAGS